MGVAAFAGGSWACVIPVLILLPGQSLSWPVEANLTSFSCVPALEDFPAEDNHLHLHCQIAFGLPGGIQAGFKGEVALLLRLSPFMHGILPSTQGVQSSNGVTD
jgi:hypothetical protein